MENKFTLKDMVGSDLLNKLHAVAKDHPQAEPQANYKIFVVKGEDCAGIAIQRLDNNGNNAVDLAGIYVDELISYREGLRRAVKYVDNLEDKEVRLVISLPKNICGAETFKMVRRQAPLREIAIRAYPRALNLNTPKLAFKAIENKANITGV